MDFIGAVNYAPYDTESDLLNEKMTMEKTLEESIVMTMLTLTDSIRRHGDSVTKQNGITTQQWLILLYLANDPNIPLFHHEREKSTILASEIADALNVSRPNITNLVNSLIDKGLVVQIEDTADRRRKFLTLTIEGRNTVSAIEPSRHKANSRLLAHLTEAEKKQFLTFLIQALDIINRDFGK